MLTRHLIVPAVTVFVGGCTALPTFPREGAVAAGDIVRHVECELQAAYSVLRPDYAKLEDWAAGYKLTFKADAQHAGGLSGSWTIPGGVAVAPGANVSATGSRQGVVKYQRDFKDIAVIDCDKAGSDTNAALGRFRGDVGILEWLRAALAPSGGFQRAPKELTYQVSFVSRYDASLKPTFAIVNLSGGPVLSFNKSNTDTLDIVFVDVTQTPPKPPKPIPVYIVPSPGGATATEAVAPEAAARGTTLSIEVQERIDSLLDNQ